MGVADSEDLSSDVSVKHVSRSSLIVIYCTCHVTCLRCVSGVSVCLMCQELTAHGSVLDRGVSLLRAVSVSEAISGELPFGDTSRSCERDFLTDFINCGPHTSAARLAT